MEQPPEYSFAHHSPRAGALCCRGTWSPRPSMYFTLLPVSETLLPETLAWQQAALAAGHAGLYDNRETVAKLFRCGAGLCAVTDGRPIGYVIFQTEGPVREVYIVEVSPGVRRRGVARRLLEAAEVQLRAAGAECLTVACTSPEGEALARCCGFDGPASQHGPGRPYIRQALQKFLTDWRPPARDPWA
jgi:GNAT superfamily N-acetyltransferase